MKFMVIIILINFKSSLKPILSFNQSAGLLRDRIRYLVDKIYISNTSCKFAGRKKNMLRVTNLNKILSAMH